MTANDGGSASGAILVVGGGIAGLTAALEAAEAGNEVYLIEKRAYLGGRVAQMHRYFPKLCPPYCGLEINFRRVRSNPRIRVLTLAELERVDGRPGNFEVTVRIAPRFVNERCTGCGDCVAACPVSRKNDFNYGLDETRAIYRSHALSYPTQFVIDRSVCPGKECSKCLPACKVEAIDLGMQPQQMKLRVGSVVLATGWQPYDATRLEGLGFGKLPDVITNTMMERLAAPNGPTGGKIKRPSDGKEPEHVTFVQCAGSRDENHLAYCSAVCCSASLKQATYVREQVPSSRVQIFYIDVRTPGRLEEFYAKVAADPNLTLVRGKAVKVTEGKAGKLVVEAEDTLAARRMRVETDLVVLATGMQPSPIAAGISKDAMGFAATDARSSGIGAAGCAHRPADVASVVQEATGAALRAVQSARRASHG